MARPLRIQYPGAVYHITSRGNDKQAIFRNKEDRAIFLNILQEINKRYHWICHAYCLMNNHYHLVIETPEGNVSIGMRQLNGVYTQAFNRRHGKTGHLFQGRYKAILIQKESHLLEVSRYVVLNPIRAEIVENPRDWAWSSYRATAAFKRPHPCLTVKWILSHLNKDTGKAVREYRKFVMDGIGKGTIWTELKGQILLGGTKFVEELKNHLRGYHDIPEIPKGQRFLNRPELGEIFVEGVVSDKAKRNLAIQ